MDKAGSFIPNCLPSVFASLHAKVSSMFQVQVEPQKMASRRFCNEYVLQCNLDGFNEKRHWRFGENPQLLLVFETSDIPLRDTPVMQ